MLAGWMLELASAANRFHLSCRVVGSAPKLEEARVVLTFATKAVIAAGLRLLCMAAPEEI